MFLFFVVGSRRKRRRQRRSWLRRRQVDEARIHECARVSHALVLLPNHVIHSHIQELAMKIARNIVHEVSDTLSGHERSYDSTKDSKDSLPVLPQLANYN